MPPGFKEISDPGIINLPSSATSVNVQLPIFEMAFNFGAGPPNLFTRVKFPPQAPIRSTVFSLIVDLSLDNFGARVMGARFRLPFVRVLVILLTFLEQLHDICYHLVVLV
ncbi:hypothetical protein D3C76_1588860 [compost metagenome]